MIGMMKTILGIKQDMTQIFDEESKAALPCTVIKVSNCVVAGLKTVEKDGYNAVVLGLGRKHNYTKSEQGKFSKLGYVPAHTREYRVDSLEGLEVGQKVDPSVMDLGLAVEVKGVSKGKGFQGVVKRHHFSGGPRTHGQSDRVRAPGSIGMRTTPGRVFKGKRMAGRMGGDMTLMNSKVLKADNENGLLVIKGSVPGGRNSILLISAK